MNKAEPGEEDHSGCHGHGDRTLKPLGAAKYFCPVCTGVGSDKPGDCPKCGMRLELITVTAATSENDNAELRDMTHRF